MVWEFAVGELGRAWRDEGAPVGWILECGLEEAVDGSDKSAAALGDLVPTGWDVSR